MTGEHSLKALLLDAGNAKVRLAGWHGGDQDPRQVGRGTGSVLPAASPLAELGVLPTPVSLSAAEDFRAEVEGIQKGYPDLPLVLTSVVPAVAELLAARWPQMTVVDHTCALPFGMALPQPESVGADRFCNVAAAAASGCDRALIVDAGTATTFDLLLDGEFVGGMIAPGMAFAATQLGESAARLAPVAFGPCPFEPGRDTAAAMRAGAFHVGVGGVEAVLEALRKKYGPMPVVVTGGLGGLLAGADRLWDRDWTLRGAAVLAGLM